MVAPKKDSLTILGESSCLRKKGLLAKISYSKKGLLIILGELSWLRKKELLAKIGYFKKGLLIILGEILTRMPNNA